MSKLIDNGISDQELKKYWDIDQLRLQLIYSVIQLDNDDSMDDCLGMFKSVQELRKQSFNKHDSYYEKLTVLNELIDGHGIEAIQVSSELYQDRYYGNCIGEYVNLGDTYELTIVWNTIDHEFEFISWGDYFEQKEMELIKELEEENKF